MESFELAEALYKGKSSLVYVAFDKISSLIVVLKLYRKSKLSVLNRFQVEREILLHTELSHEHIIDMVSCLQADISRSSGDALSTVCGIRGREVCLLGPGIRRKGSLSSSVTVSRQKCSTCLGRSLWRDQRETGDEDE